MHSEGVSQLLATDLSNGAEAEPTMNRPPDAIPKDVGAHATVGVEQLADRVAPHIGRAVYFTTIVRHRSGQFIDTPSDGYRTDAVSSGDAREVSGAVSS